MQDENTSQLSRRNVAAGAAGLAAGALAVNTAQAQTAPSDKPIDPGHLHAAGEASHDSKKACVPVLGLAINQLADGNPKMKVCVETTTNMLALTEAMHTIASHGHAHPEIIRCLAAAVQIASTHCADECEQWDHPLYKAGVEASRNAAKHAKVIVDS